MISAHFKGIERMAHRFWARLARHVGRAGLVVCCLGLATVRAQDPIVQTFFVPLPEAQLQASLKKVYSSTGSTINSVVSIVATQDGTVIYYDQWENGYENDLENPLSAYSDASNRSGTQIWGDNDATNGYPPYLNGSENTAKTDTIDAKDVVSLENNVSLPCNPGQEVDVYTGSAERTVPFDGRDKFGSTRALAVSRAEWATSPGPVLAGAIEVYAVREYGTNFESPVGEDLSSANNSMFETVGMMIMASENGTTLTVDKDGAGGAAAVVVGLNQGESYHVNGGVKSGATVSSDKSVQAHLITGDVNSYCDLQRWKDCPVGAIGKNGL